MTSHSDKHRKTYLGDGVYAVMDEYGAVVLTTENGIRATNTIVLEPEVYDALVTYVKVCLMEPHD
jgi:hypothetical protein